MSEFPLRRLAQFERLAMVRVFPAVGFPLGGNCKTTLRWSAGSGGGRGRFAGGTVAFLILLAAAAGAGIVAADLLAADHLLGFLRRARASHPHLLLFAPLAPLVLPVQLFLFVGGLQQEEPAQGFVFDAVHHGFKHVEGLALVLDQRVALAVPAQADALL